MYCLFVMYNSVFTGAPLNENIIKNHLNIILFNVFLVWKRYIQAYFYSLNFFDLFGFPKSQVIRKL